MEELFSPAVVWNGDPRDLKAGYVVSDLNGYYDSQNIVLLADGSLSLVCHHTHNREGGPGLRLYHAKSTNGGLTWSALKPIEESLTRQSHDGYQLLVPRAESPTGQRLFVLYGYNDGGMEYTDPETKEKVVLTRSDMQLKEGYYMRWSDDGGEKWSDRVCIPVRRTAIDRRNPWGGDIMGMFMCDKPQAFSDGSVYCAFQKTKEGGGETPGSEVFFLCSPDLLEVENPAEATWKTLPDGDIGLAAPEGALSLGEEPHILELPSAAKHGHQRLMSLWRCEMGRLACSYSNDGGKTWCQPYWMTQGGPPGAEYRELRNPRGAITPHMMRTPDPHTGTYRYVLTFYNNGHTEKEGYVGRRVVWMVSGKEEVVKVKGANGEEKENWFITWSQPEILFYWDGATLDDRDDWNADWAIVDGAGYIDFAETAQGQLMLVESNKLTLRFHNVDPRMLSCLLWQDRLNGIPGGGLVVDTSKSVALASAGAALKMRAPVLPDLRSGTGFTLIAWLRNGRDFNELLGKVIVDGRSTVTAALDEEPTDKTITKGFTISISDDGTCATLNISTGFGECNFTCTTMDSTKTLQSPGDHMVAFSVDGSPKVCIPFTDGVACDGGSNPQGWTAVPRDMGEIGGADISVAAPGVVHFIEYRRPLLVSELVARWRAGPAQ